MGSNRSTGKGIVLNTNQLLYFKALYEKRSLSLAARSIPISHQGLSKSLTGLEKELGARLFSLSEDGTIYPTRYAEALARYVDDWYEQYSKLRNEFEHLRESERLELHVVTATGIMGMFGDAFMSSFSDMNPKIKLICDDLPDYECDAALLTGRYRIGLTVNPYDDALRSIPLYSTRRCLWLRSEDPLSRRTTLTIEDLDGYCIGVVNEKYKNYSMLVKACENSKVTPRSIDTRSELLWLGDYAHERNHAAFTVEPAVRVFGEDRTLVGIPLDGFDWGFALSYRYGTDLSCEERAFSDFCIDYTKRHFPDNGL